MAENDRGTDRNDSSNAGDARPGLPYDPAVLAAKLAAAREQRRQVLAARAAAEGDISPEERRAKLAAFTRRADGPPPATVAGEAHRPAAAVAPAPPVSPAPPPPASDPTAAGSEPAKMAVEPGAAEAAVEPAEPSPPSEREPEPTAPRPAASADGAAGARTRTIRYAGAYRAAARAAGGGIASARGVAKPRRRRPGAVDAPASTPPRRVAVAETSSRPLARLVPLSVLVLGCLLAALLFFSPSTVRQRIADAIAPAPAPSVAPLPSASPPSAPGSGGDVSDPRPALDAEPVTPAGEPRSSNPEPEALRPPRADPEGEASRVAGPAEAGDAAASFRPRPVEVAWAQATVELGRDPPSSPPGAPTTASGSASARREAAAAVAEGATRAGMDAAATAEDAVTAATPAEDAGSADVNDGAADAEPVLPLGSAAAGSRVVLHYPASAAPQARRIEFSLRAAGVGEITPVPAAFAVSGTNVRYYRPEYRAVGQAVADLAGQHLGGGEVEIRDFTAFRPQPSPGTIEVWLAGTEEAPPPQMRTTASDTSFAAAGARAIPLQPVAPRAASARSAERERLADEVSRLLRTRLQQLQPEE